MLASVRLHLKAIIFIPSALLTWAVTSMVPSRFKLGCSDILKLWWTLFKLKYPGEDRASCFLHRELAFQRARSSKYEVTFRFQWPNGNGIAKVVQYKYSGIQRAPLQFACLSLQKSIVWVFLLRLGVGAALELICKGRSSLLRIVAYFAIVLKFLSTFLHLQVSFLVPLEETSSNKMSDKPDVSAVTTFNKEQLKKTETKEKNTLPSKESKQNCVPCMHFFCV